MQQDHKPAVYADEDKKEARRQSSTSIASTCSSTCSSTYSRFSNASQPSSRASSVTSQASFVSRYLHRRDIAMSGATVDATGTQGQSALAGPVKYNEIMAKPEYQPITVRAISERTKSRRIINLSLRKITAAEREHYDAHAVGGKQIFYIDEALSNEADLYMPAAGYMLDFEIVRGQGAPLVHILRTCQRQLQAAATSVELPQGVQLDWANFPCGITGSRPKARSATLTIDENIVEDAMTISSAAITGFTCQTSYYIDPRTTRATQVKSYALSDNRGNFDTTICLPSSTVHTPGPRKQTVQWRKLQGLETSYPDWLYGRDDETIATWLGPKDAKGRYQHFCARDVKRNLKGGIITARLVKVAGPKFIQPPQPVQIPPIVQQTLSEVQTSSEDTKGRRKAKIGKF